MNRKQERFCREYLVDFNATSAYIRAGYAEAGAGQSAHKLLKEAEIEAEIERLKQEKADVAGITVDWILNQYRMIAAADINELIAVTIGCCRYCHGIGHNYQWRYPEYILAVAAATEGEKPRPMPNADGGFDFNSKLAPVANCPSCEGEGVETVKIADTTKLTGAARRVYAGVQKTKDGLKLITRDQDGALQFLAKYKGMVIEKSERSGPNGGPIPLANLKAEDFTDDQLVTMIAAAAKNSERKG